MFGLGKKKIDIDEAAKMFLGTVLKEANEALPIWMTALVEQLVLAGVSAGAANKMLEQSRINYLYLAAVLALGMLPAKNMFGAKDSDMLLSALVQQLVFVFGSTEGLGVSEYRFKMTQSIEAHLKNATALPNDAVMLCLMDQLGFKTNKKAKTLYKNPLFVMSMSQPLVIRFAGIWKAIDNGYKIVFPETNPYRLS